MSFELIFTSAPKGLKPGSRGFTSVAFTEGMPANYVQICESLSGYVHRYELSDQNYEQNPIAYSHLVGNLGGRTFSILSRVAAYGADYTGRTNKLAHHLMIGFEERVAGGPAHAMKNGAAFISKWNEDPRFLAPNRIRLQAAEPASLKAKRWEAAIGDAGVAGMLAQAFLDAPDRPAFIVFEPGMDLLPLIAEAQTLLPDERRWDVTFSTYFTALPVGMKCAWRCCLPDSDALVTARRTPGALVINLIDKTITGAPSDPSLAEVARTGIPKAKEATIPSPSSQEMEAAPIQARPTPEAKKAPLRRPLISPDYGKVLKPKPPPQKKKSSPLAQITIFVSLLVLFGVGAFFARDWLEKRKHSPRDPEPQPVEEAIRKEEIQAQVADEPAGKPAEEIEDKGFSPPTDTQEESTSTNGSEKEENDKPHTVMHWDESETFDVPLSITSWKSNADIKNDLPYISRESRTIFGDIRFQNNKMLIANAGISVVEAEYDNIKKVIFIRPIHAQFQASTTNIMPPAGAGWESLKKLIADSTNDLTAILYRGATKFDAKVKDMETMQIELSPDDQIKRWNKPVEEAEKRLHDLRIRLDEAKSNVNTLKSRWKQLIVQYDNVEKITDEKTKSEKTIEVIRNYVEYVTRVSKFIKHYNDLVAISEQSNSKALNQLNALETQRIQKDLEKEKQLKEAEKLALRFARALDVMADDLEGELAQIKIKQIEDYVSRLQSGNIPTKAEILLDGRVIVRAEPK